MLADYRRYELANCKGLNHQNLRYAEKFYTLYKENFPQVVGELVLIPWGHHRIIIDKCKTIEKCLFYMERVFTMPNNLKARKKRRKTLKR